MCAVFLLTVDVLVQDFVSLHDKYESESESRSTVRVVHVASQQVQASLDNNIKVATCYVDISTQPKQITPISAFKDVVPTEATKRKKKKGCKLYPLQAPPEPPRTWFPGAVSPTKPKACKVELPPPR